MPKVTQETYEKTVFWKKSLFMMPTGAFAKSYVTELTKLINRWVNDSKLKNNVFKVIHVMSSLLLLKPSKTSKSKDHIKVI